ncbi:MAG: PEP-CTERM sorting domain-containing protein [Pirellulales bacterium]|nr:PEP-CTERM sorting domain-containing protein [Pirellulales bacterium]
MIRRDCHLLAFALSLILAVGPIAGNSEAVTINLTFDSGASASPSFDPTGANLVSIFQQAADYWEDIIEDLWTLDIEYYYDDLNDPDSYLGLHNNLATSDGRPTEARIRIDTQRYGVARDWWFDPTPESHTEFDIEQTLYRDLTGVQQADWFAGSPPEVLEVGFRGSAVPGGAADGHLDILSTVIHEMGHALGLTANVAAGEAADGDYDAPGSMVFGTNTDILEHAPDNYHVADRVALMCSGCGGDSLRRLPTATDVLAIAAASGWSDIDLPRQDFWGGSNWNNGYNWEGGQPPGYLDDAFVRLQGSDPTANLSANGFAANLFVGEGDNVDTEAFKLDVANTATVDGFNSDIMIRDGGELEADRVVIQNEAEVFMAGGLLDANRVTINDGTFLTGASGGSPTVDVQTMLVNNGTIRATGDAALRLSSSGGAVWDLDGAGNGVVEAVSGDVEFVSGSLSDAFDGDMVVGAGHNLTIAEPWELGAGGVLDLNGGSEPADAARLAAGGLLSALDGRIEATGDARILPDVEFGSGVQVVVPGASDSLSLYGTITYEGGSYTGAGTIYQVTEAIVSADTRIDVDVYDWDGGSGTSTTVIAGGTFTINSSRIEVGSATADGHDGEITVFGGSLVVHTDDPWRLDGTMTLIGGVVGGQDLRVFGQLAASPFFAGTTSTVEADVTFEPGSTVSVGTDCTLNLDGRTVYDGATASGVGTLVQNGNATVYGDSTIGATLYDFDGISGGSRMTIEPGVTLTINSDQIEAGDPAADGHDGIITVGDAGLLSVHTAASWRLDGALNLDNSGVAGSEMIVYGDVAISGFESKLDCDVDFRSSAAVTIPGTSMLEINGRTIFNGGTYNGGGIITQDGDAAVQSSTTIDVHTYDLDGTSGTTEVTFNDPLTLNVTRIDTVGSTFDGVMNINLPGVLNVNTPLAWTMGGTANLDQNGLNNRYMINGADVTISGQINVTGATAIGARFDLTGEINLGDPGDYIQLGGGNANTIDGGRIVGPGTVSSGGGSLIGNGSISADVEFFASTDLLAQGGTLSVSGAIVQVGTIGTAASSGRLDVTLPWNTNVADRLELRGGEVTGAEITNDGATIGRGLLAPTRFVNNGTLTASGGTLTVHTASNPDLDGSGTENGVVDTGSQLLHVLNDYGGLYAFNGTLNTRAGGEFRMDTHGLVISNVTTPGRMNMSGGRYNAPRLIQQSILRVENMPATIESNSTFTETSDNSLMADLQLLGTADIQNGATFTGTANLVVGTGAMVDIEDDAAIDVSVVNHGTLNLGLSPGAVKIGGHYEQTRSGELGIELGGTMPGPRGYDQLIVKGDASLAGDLGVALWGGFVPDRGQEFTIVDVGGSLDGQFAGLGEGDWVGNFGGTDLEITYRAGTGNDVALIAPWAEVTGRYVFYDGSSFDNPLRGYTDDDAIAPDKQPLLPGQTATFDNYTSYSRGINGVMIDVEDLGGAATIEADDFAFKVGNSNDLGTWSSAPDPIDVILRPGEGEGGSDRITIFWNDNAIQKEWLQIVMLANDDTGLLADDVFYFGNAIADAGDSSIDAKVNATDMLLARNNPRTFLNPAGIDFPYDYNRDDRVNATDMLLARNNQTHFLNALKLITVPGAKSAELATVPEPGTLIMLAVAVLGLLLWRRCDKGRQDRGW